MIANWDELPEFMRTERVKPYWETLWKRRRQLRLKRVFDVIISVIMITLLFIPMFVIAVVLKMDSKGPILYRQLRVTQYGRMFKINKFRTMYDSSSQKDVLGNQIGNSVTVANDIRVTKIGRLLRKYRLDEFPQLFNILMGDMSFVGTRPEVEKYVRNYRDEWNATLLLPAGVTSECSIIYKDEERLLDGNSDVDKIYIEKVLPLKMEINLKSLRHFCFIYELGTMVRTVVDVLGKD